MLVLGIETSCDETAAAVVRDGREVLSDVVSTQIEIHRRWGGVVPELASRNHVLQVMPVIDEAMEKAGVSLEELDGIAVTSGPGLIGALLVGVQAGKAIAWACGKPVVGVNHLEGHLLAVRLGARCARAALPRPRRFGRPYQPLRRRGLRETTGSSAPPSTTPPARPSTRSPSCSACPIPAASRSIGWRRPAIPTAIRFPRGLTKRVSLDFSFSGPEDLGALPPAEARHPRGTGARRFLRQRAGGDRRRAHAQGDPRGAGRGAAAPRALRRRRGKQQAARPRGGARHRGAGSTCTFRRSVSAPTTAR